LLLFPNFCLSSLQLPIDLLASDHGSDPSEKAHYAHWDKYANTYMGQISPVFGRIIYTKYDTNVEVDANTSDAF
jgi:hypothetical protein